MHLLKSSMLELLSVLKDLMHRLLDFFIIFKEWPVAV